jgi:IS5 family transposase
MVSDHDSLFVVETRGIAMKDGQFSLVDALVSRRLGSNEKLERISSLIDWQALAPLARQVRPGETGRPPYDALAMLKALYLQALYDLSDPGLEEALLDRLSFRRFCGFGLDQETPDETTLCRFRQEAARVGVLEACLGEVNRQLSAQGLLLRKGTLLDATLVTASRRAPGKEAGLGGRHPQEPDADWTKKNGRSVFGYKAHLAVDEGSGLVRRVIVTSAKIYESLVADDLICGDERAVYGDKAYEHKGRRQRLKAAGIKDRLMHRRHKHIAELPRWQQRRNQLIARRRAPVEAVFSAMKRIYGLGRARCLTLARNTADILAFATVYNLCRAIKLTAP